MRLLSAVVISLFFSALPRAYAAPPETAAFKTLWGVFHGAYTDNFYSVNESDIDKAIGTYGYGSKKKVALVASRSLSGPFVSDNAVAFCRLFRGAPATDHFYTIDINERGLAQSYGYTFEGVEGFLHATQTPGTVFLYRLSKFWGETGAVEHWYGTDPGERSMRIGLGYLDELAAGFAWPIPQVNQPLPGFIQNVVVYKDDDFHDLYVKGPAVISPGDFSGMESCGGTADIYRDNVFVQQVSFNLRRNRHSVTTWECYATITSIGFGPHTYRAEFSGYAARIYPTTGDQYISYQPPYTFEGNFTM